MGGKSLSEGWPFVFWVSTFARAGWSAAWVFITNFNHSHWWNEFLASDPDRTWPMIHNIMAFLLGGRHRWNEMLFHGWEKVHDACVEMLSRGLWKSEDAETIMDKHHRKRSMLVKSRKASIKK